MDNVNRIRTITQCLSYIKSIDQDSSITEWFIRNLCKADKIKHIVAGKGKIMVNLDSLISYINCDMDKGV